jgi:hypothetical protein
LAVVAGCPERGFLTAYDFVDGLRAATDFSGALEATAGGVAAGPWAAGVGSTARGAAVAGTVAMVGSLREARSLDPNTPSDERPMIARTIAIKASTAWIARRGRDGCRAGSIATELPTGGDESIVAP